MDLEKRWAEALQDGLPLTERPYRDLAKTLSCDEESALLLTRGLIDKGLVRSFGVFADYERLGYEGLLCGIAVPEERVDDIGAMLNARREVTHNYLRNHAVNLWCTGLFKDRPAAERFVEDALRAVGCPFVALATTFRLKLRPVFRLSGEREGEQSNAPEGHEADTGVVPSGAFAFSDCAFSDEDVAALSSLQIDFPVVPRPFEEAARKLGTTERELLERLTRLRSAGALRRLGASLNHRGAGYKANALAAWDAEDIAEAGRQAARFPWVSHCYLRTVRASTLPFDWPYPLYTMLHARDEQTLDARVREMRAALSPRAVVVLPTVRELKKARYIL